MCISGTDTRLSRLGVEHSLSKRGVAGPIPAKGVSYTHNFMVAKVNFQSETAMYIPESLGWENIVDKIPSKGARRTQDRRARS